MELQYNGLTGKPYEGNNQATLMTVTEDCNYTSNAWYTFLQAREKGLKVRKGERGTQIIKGFSQVDVEVKGKKEGEKKIETITRPNGVAYVFNENQLDKVEK